MNARSSFLKIFYSVAVMILLTRYDYGDNAPVYHPVDKQQWEKTVKGLDYTEKKKEEKDTQQPEQKGQSTGTLPSNLLQILFYVAVIGLLLFILIRVFGKGLFNKNKKNKIKDIYTVDDLDDHPMESDLERFLREAIAQKNYRLAIRIYYLMTLQLLQEKKYILWRKNKTGLDYLSELSDHPSYAQMSNNTLLFEYVWYGEKNPDEDQFNSASHSFTSLMTTLNTSVS